MKHNWHPLCSDINTHWSETYAWWRCSNCGKETEHIKQGRTKEPSDEGCLAEEEKNIFPLSSI